MPPPTFWDALDPGDARELAALCGPRRFERGELPIYESQVPGDVLFLRSGRVKIRLVSGRHEAVLAFRGPGDIVGELAAVDDQPRSATVCAVTPVEARALPAAAFRAFLLSHPKAALVLLALLSGRLRDADAKRIEFMRDTVDQRAAARLLEFGARFGSDEGGRTVVPITEEELAGAVFASVRQVQRTLKVMRSLGYIETDRRGDIRILDAAAIHATWVRSG